MPLTRDTVTAASRIMLPTYILAFTWIGAGWAFDDRRQLTSAPALRFIDGILPIHWWGALLLTSGILIGAALIAHHRTLCRYALWVAALVMCVFVTAFSVAALTTDTSPGAPAWPLLVAAACLASERSLLKGERN